MIWFLNSLLMGAAIFAVAVFYQAYVRETELDTVVSVALAIVTTLLLLASWFVGVVLALVLIRS